MQSENQQPVMLDKPSKFSRIWAKIKSFKNLSRPKKIGIILFFAVLFGVGIWAGFFRSVPAGQSEIITKSKDQPPATIASPLTGIQVKPDLANRPVTAVMIENSPDARPQSGLEDAGVVFEAQAEGGITRFAALFQEATPQYIGPVRSVRPYYLDWIKGFDASVAHVGGSAAGLAEVRNGMRDLDQFFNPDSYWRISSRYSPHNVYTSFAKLDALNNSKGYKSSSFTSWPRKPDSKLATPTAATIDLAISGYYYDVTYKYNPTTNSYDRYVGGQKHMNIVDAAGTSQVWLSPKVVIAIAVPLNSGQLDSQGAAYSDYQDVGSGAAYVFQDGGVTTGTWAKSSASGQISFSDSQGNPIKLNAGQTWITAVTNSTGVSYTAQ